MTAKVYWCFSVVFLSLASTASPSPEEIAEIKKAIVLHNAEWEAGTTSVSDLSPAERKMLFGGLKSVPQPTDTNVEYDMRAEDLPSYFDWRANNGNWLTPVKDQGSCGSCWAFADIGAFESMLKIGWGQPTLDFDLSEQMLVSCSDAGNCISGGFASIALAYLRDTGVVDEACFPYAASDADCSPCTDSPAKISKCSFWWSVADYPPYVEKIKNSLYTNGPVIAWMMGYSDLLTYQTGVYQHVSGEAVDGHYVVITGWDDSNNCWIVKNSWGTDWGENGYFRIIYDDCGIGEEALACAFFPPTPPTPTATPTPTARIITPTPTTRVTTPTPTARVTTPTPTPGVVTTIAHWKLDESSGNTAFDETDYHHNGTLVNGPVWQPAGGRFFGALRFDGINDRVEVPNAGQINQLNSISVTAWFKTSQAATAFTSIIRHDGHFTALQLTGSGQAQVAYWPGGGLIMEPFAWTYSDNAWHHLASVYDKGTGLRVYIDGNLVASNDVYTGALSVSDVKFCLGSTESGTEPYNGLLDDVRMFDKALSRGEVLALYRGRFSPWILDYNGDGTSDIGIFRPGEGRWAIRNVLSAYFGSSTDFLGPADYNGDGTTDIAIFRGSSGMWSVRNLSRFYLGGANDRPVPGDYNGDATAEAGIFRESSGLWSIRDLTRIYLGAAGDTVTPGYYDADTSKDIAIFRGSSGMWSVRNITRFYFGSATDALVPGDYNGAGKWESGIFRPSCGMWSIRNVTRVYLGSANDWALPADYDGNGIDDAGIFRDSTGMWSIRNLTRVYFGATGDIPITR